MCYNVDNKVELKAGHKDSSVNLTSTNIRIFEKRLINSILFLHIFHMHASNMNEKRDKNREDKTAPKYDGRESLLYEGEHHQRQRHLGESKVNMTLSLVK